MTFKSIKELESDFGNIERLHTLKDVLGLIDERIKMLKELLANSKMVKNGDLKDIFEACVSELEELKRRIER